MTNKHTRHTAPIDMRQGKPAAPSAPRHAADAADAAVDAKLEEWADAWLTADDRKGGGSDWLDRRSKYNYMHSQEGE